tara:strand:- start:4653 stop:6461 length:1809 start_codon:yes stop_codon:yes gene_type:complete
MSAELILNLINEVLGSNLKLEEKVIEEQSGDMTLTYNAIPEIPLSEIGWSQLETREGGVQVPSEERKQLQDFLSNIPGKDIGEKMRELNKFFQGDEAYLKQAGFVGVGGADGAAKLISYLVFYKTLTTIITHFNAASAGFSFESFLAVLLGGQQIPTGQQTIADMVDGQGTPISLKLYKEGQLKVGGSFTDLSNDLISKGEMQYVNVTKELSGEGLEQKGKLDFYRFNFNLDNAFNIIARGSGKHRKCVLLPKTFMDSKGENTENIPGRKASLPSPEDLETQYQEIVKKGIADRKEEIEAEIGEISDELIDKIILNFNYSDPQNLTGKAPVHGKSTIRKSVLANTIHGFISDRFEKKRPTATDTSKTLLYKIFLAANDEGILSRYKGDELSKLRQKQVNELYFYGDISDEERIEISRKFYQEADAELKKECLKVAKGYIDNMQFELNQKMVQNIDKLAAPTPGNLFPEGQNNAGPIATINIGVENVKQMLDRVTGELNQIVFGIFQSLKSLTQQLQNYFAGGLQDDGQASQARQAAIDIEERTAEVQAQRAKDTDRAKAQRASATKRQASAGQKPVGTMSDVRESKEFDEQLELLTKEVFGK